MSWFLYRLLPPRPDFAATMSDDEQATMGRHSQYWTEHLRDGRAMIFTPVADPAGVWGMAIVQGQTADDVAALGLADPAVTSGIARFDVVDLPGAVTAA
jgi:hypothetical protein